MIEVARSSLGLVALLFVVSGQVRLQANSHGYFVNALGRANIGNARTAGMQDDLGFSDTQVCLLIFSVSEHSLECAVFGYPPSFLCFLCLVRSPIQHDSFTGPAFNLPLRSLFSLGRRRSTYGRLPKL